MAELLFFQAEDERPLEIEFRAWADALSGEFADLHREQEAEEHVYFQQFAVFTPDTAGAIQPVQAVKTGSAPADADAMMDSLVPPKIQITCKPRRGREKHRKQARKLALAGAAILESWRRRKDVLQQLAADMVIQRVAVARVVYDRALWPPYPADFQHEPARSEGEDDETYADRLAQFEESREDWELSHRKKWPIRFERRNPRTTRWRQDESSGELLVVAERYSTTALEALQTFRGYKEAREYLQQFKDTPSQPVTVTDVWYGRWRCMYLDEVPIFPDAAGHVLPHGYACIPYLIAAFRELPFDEPNKKYRGGLTNAASLYPLESNVLTMHVAILAWNAWRTWVGWTADGRDFDVIPGQYIPIDKRKQEYLEMLSGEAVPPELLQTSATVDQYVQRNGVAQGPRTSEGTRSAQQLWAIQAMRAIKIERAKAALSMLVSAAIGYALMMVEQNIKEKITLPSDSRDEEGQEIGEVSFGPADIQGYWDGIRANFVTRLDPAVLEQAKALMALSQNNFMPWNAAVEMSGMTDNPQAWEDDIFREKAERSPLLIDVVTLEKLVDYYGEEHPWVKRAEEKIFAQGGGQGGNKPMQPTNPMKGAGANGAGAPADAAAALAGGFAGRGRVPKGPARGGGGRKGAPYGGA